MDGTLETAISSPHDPVGWQGIKKIPPAKQEGSIFYKAACKLPTTNF